MHTNLFELLFLLGNLGWNGGILQMYARTRFIHRVYCLVRHKTVTDVAGCQFDTSLQCIVGVSHVVMIFVATLHVLQNLQCLLVGCRFYHHLLETALQGSVLFDGVAVFVQCRGSDTLYGSACQCRFQNVCGIHCTSSRTCTNHGVYLVDKYNDIRILLQFFDEHLHALFKLSAILRTSYHTCHIERYQTLVEEHRRAVVCGNHLCQSFDDGTLSNAGFTNQNRVVFLAASKDFDDALDLVLTAHTGVKGSLQCQLCQVGTEIIQYGGLRFRLLGLSGRRAFSSGRTAGRATVGGSVLLLFVVLLGQSDAVFHAEHVQRVVIIHVVHFQNLFRTIVCCVVQDSQQHVLHIYECRTLQS